MSGEGSHFIRSGIRSGTIGQVGRGLGEKPAAEDKGVYVLVAPIKEAMGPRVRRLEGRPWAYAHLGHQSLG